jgi:hypothetical protein
MNKQLIWIDDDDFSGWCCSRCTWGMTAPRLESTVAALAFNRVAQEDFEKHTCVHNAQGDARYASAESRFLEVRGKVSVCWSASLKER